MSSASVLLRLLWSAYAVYGFGTGVESSGIHNMQSSADADVDSYKPCL